MRVGRLILILLFTVLVAGSKFEVMSGDRPININMMPKDKKEAVMRFYPDSRFIFEKNGSVIAEVKNNSLEWKVHADLTYVKVTGSISHRSFIGKDFKLVRNWQLVHLDNFANGEKNGWQGAKTIIRGCGPSKDKSLFRDCITKTNYVEKKFIGLSTHSEIMVDLIVHFIDQWEGELAYLQIENDVVWTRTHNWCHTIFNHKCILNGLNVCENAYPDLVGQNVKFVYKHDKPSLTIRFGSSLATNNCKANWGFNNLMVYVR